MKNYTHFAALYSTIFTVLSLPSVALADCNEMGSDQWNDLSARMSEAYDAGDYETALSYGKTLILICDQSPITNVVISDIYAKLGHERDSYNYIRRASEFTQQYQLPQPIVEKIWLRRAEFELPYKEQASSLQKQLDEAQAQLAAQKADFEAQLANVVTPRCSTDDTRRQFEILQWTGTGIAAAGGILLIAGASLIGAKYTKANDEFRAINGSNDDAQNKKDFNEYDKSVKAGYASLFTGLGLGVAGAFMAIYSHLKLKQRDEETTSFSLDIAPNAATFRMTF